MDKQDLEIVESLCEPAKKLFYSLDRNSQKRILKQAKELATKQVNAEKEKSRIIKKDQIKREQKKVNQAKNKIEESKKAAFLNSSNMKSVGNADSSVYKGITTYREVAIYPGICESYQISFIHRIKFCLKMYALDINQILCVS